ncbi:MAG: primosomal protein N' [Syntrophaceae bacterium]|nr:primosomal protein N' [Syntrophaceae bacterium]
MSFVQVALNVPARQTFTYRLPEGMDASVAVGKRVLVPLGRRRQTGYVVGILKDPDCESPRDVLEILDDAPLFSREEFLFYSWVADYYLYPVGRALGEILPGSIPARDQTRVSLNRGSIPTEAGSFTPLQERIMAVLRERPRGLSLRQLKALLKTREISGTLEGLAERRWIRLADEGGRGPEIRLKAERVVSMAVENPEGLTSRQEEVVRVLRRLGTVPTAEFSRILPGSAAILTTLKKKGIVLFERRPLVSLPGLVPVVDDPRTGLTLNPDQVNALEAVRLGLSREASPVILLHGVTGSGKTEVYLRAASEVLERGGSVLFLVPEIALTPQLLNRVAGVFDATRIAVLHSGISRADRYSQWRRIQRGEADVVVGARSALFAPLKNLKLIIVDEEHDPSYKQDERLCYSARDMAVVRGKLASATVILGSATPSVQTYFNAESGRYLRRSLPFRVEDRDLPVVEIVDMRVEGLRAGELPILSYTLRNALTDNLAARGQALIFLNRRGFHTHLFCASCGHVFTCRNCSLSLISHARAGVLRCHACDFSMPAPAACPACGSPGLVRHGLGTERVEEAVRTLLPQARVGRMDSDTTARKGASADILRRLLRGEIDILVGTQMITKGHDIPGITLVGVVSADTSLHTADFRAAERTFQLLTQVSGRSGRGDTPGRVVIQTYNPEHYAVRHARGHDFEAFYRDEIPQRQALSYPPFTRLAQVRISGLDSRKTREGAGAAASFASRFVAGQGLAARVEVLGPAEAPVARVKNRHRWQILLKGKDSRALHAVAETLLVQRFPGVEIKIDVDPMDFL